MISQISKIKVKNSTTPGKIISLSKKYLKETSKEIKLEALGKAISNLVNIIESLKLMIPGLHQENKISSITSNYNYIPKFEVTLSLNIPLNRTKEGYQPPLSESNRREIKSIMISKSNKFFTMRGRMRIRLRNMRRPLGRNIRRNIRGSRGMERGRGMDRGRGLFRGIDRVRGFVRRVRGGRGRRG